MNPQKLLNVSLDVVDSIVVGVLTSVILPLCKITKTTADDEAIGVMLQYPDVRRWGIQLILNLFGNDEPLDRMAATVAPEAISEQLAEANMPLGKFYDFLQKWGPLLFMALKPLLNK